LAPGDINTGTGSSRLGAGRKAEDLTLEKIIVAKSKEVKTGCNLAESSKKGSKRAALPMMIIMVDYFIVYLPLRNGCGCYMQKLHRFWLLLCLGTGFIRRTCRAVMLFCVREGGDGTSHLNPVTFRVLYFTSQTMNEV
jgi:hypothetical protein